MIRESLLALLAALSGLYQQSVHYIRPYLSQLIDERPVVIIEHNEPVEQQEEAPIEIQLQCGVCQELVTDDATHIIVTDCNGASHVAHIACLNAHLQSHGLSCPTCGNPFGEQNLDHVLMVLNDGDVVIPEEAQPQEAPVEYAECSICLDDCDQQWPHVVTLHCSHGEHQFHESCLYEAVHDNNLQQCPNCRTQIAEQDRELLNLAHAFVHEDASEASSSQSTHQEPVQPECSICLDVIESDGQALPCAHVFHEHCVQTWLAGNQTCPVCRQHV